MSLQTRIERLEAAQVGPDTCPCGRSRVDHTVDAFGRLVVDVLAQGGAPAEDWARCRWCGGMLPPLPDDFMRALEALSAGDPAPLQTMAARGDSWGKHERSRAMKNAAKAPHALT
ncbi:MAG: hypothetical protein ACHQ9S_28070 [Candidatus Binatia bacterium]